MTGLMKNKVAAITGAASGIGLECAKILLEEGARVVLIDRAEDRLRQICADLGPEARPLVVDLMNGDEVSGMLPRILEAAGGRLDIFHANAGLYVGGDLIDASHEQIDRMLQLNVAVVMKNVRDVLPHMIDRGRGDIIVTSSLAAHFPTPWEPVYASSKWAIDCFVQTTRRQVFRHGLRVGSISPGPVLTGLTADWPADRLAEARASGSLIEPAEVGAVITFMLTRPRGVTIRDVVLMPSNFDL